jgi:gliding motility-associated-like protein
VNVAIAVCGCTDPVAINYNPNAQLNDGTCMYPVPTVEIPNVFTPDGDVSKANEIYFLTTTNAINVEFTIFNRWGDIVYSGSGINPAPAWDGKDNGMEVTEGVYFIQYKISGYNNQVLEGHGFLHLIRK